MGDGICGIKILMVPQVSYSYILNFMSSIVSIIGILIFECANKWLVQTELAAPNSVLSQSLWLQWWIHGKCCKGEKKNINIYKCVYIFMTMDFEVFYRLYYYSLLLIENRDQKVPCIHNKKEKKFQAKCEHNEGDL